LYPEYQTLLGDAWVPTPSSKDGSSFANIDDIISTGFHLDISVDFANKKIFGNNTINLTAQTDSVAAIVLDYQGINVKNVWIPNGDDVKVLNFDASYHNASLGSALRIDLTDSNYTSYLIPYLYRAQGWR
jgi:hypothetical protein